MTMNWSDKEQTLEDFLEQDLPFLINSHYDDTILLLKRELQLLDTSLDLVVAQYPNFLTKIKYHLYFFFAYQMSQIDSINYDFYAHYCKIAIAYRNEYIYSFVANQIQDEIIRELKQRNPINYN